MLTSFMFIKKALSNKTHNDKGWKKIPRQNVQQVKKTMMKVNKTCIIDYPKVRKKKLKKSTQTGIDDTKKATNKTNSGVTKDIQQGNYIVKKKQIQTFSPERVTKSSSLASPWIFLRKYVI